MNGGSTPLHGRKPGDRRVRVQRVHTPYFRYTGPGQLVAKPAASTPASGLAHTLAEVKAFFIGRPLANAEEIGERLAKKKALAIFSSDAISSSAYATEEIVLAFILAASTAAAFQFSLWVALAIAGLLGIVAFSYRQVCIAYPTGGGSYSVSKANFGRLPSLVAASALLVDYVLTVAVSTSSAVEQLASAVPALDPWRVQTGLVAVALITLGNLRGIREAGNIFAIPTYLFLGGAFTMIVAGVVRIVAFGDPGPAATVNAMATAQATAVDVSMLVLLRAFAAGAVALTGTEAIATGVPAFKPPESANAAKTLMSMAIILGVLFVGITFLATQYHIAPIEAPKQTVISQIARHVYGDSFLFLLFQSFTALLLFLAANTSYNAFPRLVAVLAADGFMPRQFSFRGDRLAYSTGIIALGLIAATVITLGHASTHALIPLYAVGVFIDFTIAQAGMVHHWWSSRDSGWRHRLAINAVGCMLTLVIAIVVTTVKAPTSLVVVALIPALVTLMLFIRRQYDLQTDELAVASDVVFGYPHRSQRVVIPVNGINPSVVRAVMFGRAIAGRAGDILAVSVTTGADEAAELRTRWTRQFPEVPLVIVESPYRALVGPLVTYLDVLELASAPDSDPPLTIVVIPEYVAKHWWERILYNQSARRLRAALVGRDRTVVADVPYRRSEHTNRD